MSEPFIQMAKDFQAHPDNLRCLVAEGTPTPRNDAEQDAMTHELRPELYALCALLADEILEQALQNSEQYPPFGLCTEMGRTTVPEVPTFGDLHTFLNFSLDKAQDDVLHRHISSQSPVYERLSQLCSVFRASENVDRYMSGSKLLRAGIGTATTETVIAMQTVARVVSHDNPNIPPQRIVEIVRNSEILMNRFAGIGLDRIKATERVLAMAGVEPNQKTLTIKTRADGQQYVDFGQPIAELPDLTGADDNELIGEIPLTFDEVLGCPARIGLNGTSAINKLWRWAVDIAEQARLFDTSYSYRRLAQ